MILMAHCLSALTTPSCALFGLLTQVLWDVSPLFTLTLSSDHFSGGPQDQRGLKKEFHPEKERTSGHTSSPQLNSTVCIEPFISLLGSVLRLKGNYRTPLCYWCQCQKVCKDAEQGAQCYLFKYRQGQAQRYRHTF